MSFAESIGRRVASVEPWRCGSTIFRRPHTPYHTGLTRSVRRTLPRARSFFISLPSASLSLFVRFFYGREAILRSCTSCARARRAQMPYSVHTTGPGQGVYTAVPKKRERQRGERGIVDIKKIPGAKFGKHHKLQSSPRLLSSVLSRPRGQSILLCLCSHFFSLASPHATLPRESTLSRCGGIPDSTL